jgi:hypothetical protein
MRRRTAAAEYAAAKDEFFNILFLSLIGLDLSLWFLAKGLFVALPG